MTVGSFVKAEASSVGMFVKNHPYWIILFAFLALTVSCVSGASAEWAWNKKEPGGADHTLCENLPIETFNKRDGVVWAALGDSYSAGEGGAITGGSGNRDVTNAYAFDALASLQGAHDGVRMEWGACGGAVVRQVVGDANTTAKTLDAALGANIVSVTMGGNDAGFADVAKECLFHDCQALKDGHLFNTSDPDLAGKPAAEQWQVLETKLENGYRTIAQKMAKGGHLYVLEYPLPFTDPKLIAPRSEWDRLVCSSSMVANDHDDRAYLLNRFAARLDATVARAVEQVKTENVNEVVVHHLPWGFAEGSSYPMPIGKTADLLRWDNPAWFSTTPADWHRFPFNPHGRCSDKPFINGFAYADGRTFSDTFHPSTAGKAAAGCFLARAVFDAQHDAVHPVDLTTGLAFDLVQPTCNGTTPGTGNP